MCKFRKWVLLEHLGALDDPIGRHFDLLLEDGQACRTWRLDTIPTLNGPGVKATLIKPHKLNWLEKESGSVSGGRGWAKRIQAGTYQGELPMNYKEDIALSIKSYEVEGLLEIKKGFCKICT